MNDVDLDLEVKSDEDSSDSIDLFAISNKAIIDSMVS